MEQGGGDVPLQPEPAGALFSDEGNPAVCDHKCRFAEAG